MTVLTWPARFRRAVTSNCVIEANTRIFMSPVTRSAQAIRLQGERWRNIVTLPPMYRADGQALDAFLAQLDGAFGMVALHNFERPYPAGDNRSLNALPLTHWDDDTQWSDGTQWAGGPDVVRTLGAHQAGANVLLTEQWYPSVTGILLAGDFIGVGGRLHMVTSDADSDASGHAALQIRPRLRAAVASLSTVTRTRPTSPFRLADDRQPARQVDGLIYRWQPIEFVEVI